MNTCAGRKIFLLSPTCRKRRADPLRSPPTSSCLFPHPSPPHPGKTPPPPYNHSIGLQIHSSVDSMVLHVR
eukprot:8436807-Pyramimonas_sp.AAC.1